MKWVFEASENPKSQNMILRAHLGHKLVRTEILVLWLLGWGPLFVSSNLAEPQGGTGVGAFLPEDVSQRVFQSPEWSLFPWKERAYPFLHPLWQTLLFPRASTGPSGLLWYPGAPDEGCTPLSKAEPLLHPGPQSLENLGSFSPDLRLDPDVTTSFTCIPGMWGFRGKEPGLVSHK